MDELELRLGTLLRESAQRVQEDGFSERVVLALPRRRFTGTKARRLGMGASAAIGGGLGLAFGTPLEQIASALLPGPLAPWLLPALFIGLLALPVIWSLTSD